MKRILVGPAVSDQATLASLVARLGHYLAHIDVEQIVISVTPELLRAGCDHIVSHPELPTGFDPDVAGRVGDISSRIKLQTAGAGLSGSQLGADFLLLWDTGARRTEPWRSVAKAYRRDQTLFDVDWQRTRLDGARFGELVAALSADSRAFDPAESERFVRRTEHLLESSTAYLVATGPTARRGLDVAMGDGVRIVCNTTILDDELMAHVQPQIVTFADPIFHFGPSTYAHHFQRNLARLAVKHDFTVVTIERYAGLLRDRLPQLADRIVGVRMGRQSWPQNYDLTAELAVKPYPNILTMLMLPLAATFSRSIELFGFDGRNPRDSYFWRHGASVQFDRELDDVKLVHPGFFQFDYGSYYDQHVAAVEQMLLDLELRNCRIRSRTPSFMPPLRRRSSTQPTLQSGQLARRPASGTIVSIAPDWTGDFGHYGPWERAVGAAARARGFAYRSLGSRALEPPDESAVPIFTHGTQSRESTDMAAFDSELREALTGVVDDFSIVIFYAADVWHLPALLSVAAEHPRCTFVVNLMRTHVAIASAVAGRLAEWPISVQLLNECVALAAGTNVHVCMDTPTIVDEVEQLFGHRPQTWPMVMLGDPQLLASTPETTSEGSVRLVAPVHASADRGFPETVELAERLSPSLGLGRLSLVARYAPQLQAPSRAMKALADRFTQAGGELATENLSDAGYAALVRSADIVLLPYRLSTFRTRTSGVVLDAVAAGRPCIAVRGTWAGDLVDRHGVGATYEDCDIDSFESAIQHVSGELDRYRRRVGHARDPLLNQYRPERLVSFVSQLASVRNPPPDSAGLLSLQRFARLASHAYRQSNIDRDDQRFRHLVVVDDIERAREDALDRLQRQWAISEVRQRRLRRFEGIASEEAPPRIAASTRPGVPRDLDRNVYERATAAHLDELALVAEVVVPERLRGAVMVDVGAHHGSAFRRFRAAGWRIYAFEPDPRHATFLTERYSDDDRVVLDDRAVANVTAEGVPFYISEESSGISGLTAFRDSHVPIGDVETVALRDVRGLDRVDLLKVDTEGYEMFVLEGFPWGRLDPAVVVAEFEDTKTTPLGYTTADLIAYLRHRQYQVWVSEWHPIVRYGIRHDWHQLVSSDDYVPDSAAWGNLIAFRQPVEREVMGRAVAAVLEIGAGRQ